MKVAGKKYTYMKVAGKNFKRYVHVYLFVVYFSFAPVISAITHLYCELFYIQVLTMVIITETLTSTSHHDIFTYLDYIFPATFILSDFIHIYFHIYIYIYIIIMSCSQHGYP